MNINKFAKKVFKKSLKLKQSHIDNGYGGLDDNPLVSAIKEHTGLSVFSTGVNVYVFDGKHELPDWTNPSEYKNIPHAHLCFIGDKMKEWINDFEQAWISHLYPDPVTLIYKDGVLDIKGNFIGAFDMKFSCDLDEDAISCDCFVCEHNEWDIELTKHRTEESDLVFE